MSVVKYMNGIKYTVRIKVREEGQAKGTSYTPYICDSLEESLEKVKDFFEHGDCPVQEYPDIRIKAEKIY